MVENLAKKTVVAQCQVFYFSNSQSYFFFQDLLQMLVFIALKLVLFVFRLDCNLVYA